MQNFEIFFIVFGAGGVILFICIFVFKWMGISYKECFSRKEHLCQDDIKRKFMTSQANITHLETSEASDFANICISALNTDSLITHHRPILKYTTPSNYDFQDETNNALEIKHKPVCARLKLETSYDAYDENLKVKFSQLKEICFGSNKENKEFFYSIESYSFYFVVWIDDFNKKEKTKTKNLSGLTLVDSDFEWVVSEEILSIKKVRILLYLTNLKTNEEVLFGQVSLQLNTICSEKQHTYWQSLYDPEQDSKISGDVLLSLSYLPTAERLTATIIEAKNLKFKNNIVFGDTFSTISLYTNNHELLSSFKTSVRTNNHNPQFNEISVFTVPTNDLNNIYFKITVYQSSTIINEEDSEIGKFFARPDKIGSHWDQMIRLPRRQVIVWYQLEKSLIFI